jgi:mRNA-degrading endonuclease RelE of RelBE toxin-antitoxin system
VFDHSAADAEHLADFLIDAEPFFSRRFRANPALFGSFLPNAVPMVMRAALRGRANQSMRCPMTVASAAGPAPLLASLRREQRRIDKNIIQAKLPRTVTVLITNEAQDEFNDLPKIIRARIEKVIVRLEKWPDVSGAKPLSGDLAGHYRVRTGDYRVQFQVAGDVLAIEKVGHRDGFYGE